MVFGFYMLVPVLPVYMHEVLGANAKQIGLVIPFYAVGALLVRPFCGYVLDNIGRKFAYLAGFFCFSFLFLGYGVFESLIALLFVRFLHGITWGIVSTGGQTITVDILPESRMGEGISYYGVSMGLAMAMGPLLGFWLLESIQGLKYFAVVSLICLVAWGIALIIRYPAYKSEQRKLDLDSFFEKKSLPCSLVCMIYCFANAAIITYVPLYCEEYEALKPSNFFCFYSLTLCVVRLFGGKIFDKCDPIIPVTIGFFSAIIGHLLLKFSDGPIYFHLAACFTGLGGGMVFPCFSTSINNLVTIHRRGAANATYFSALDIGVCIGIVVFGQLAYHFGSIRHIYSFAATLVLTAYFLYLFYAHPHYNKHTLKK